MFPHSVTPGQFKGLVWPSIYLSRLGSEAAALNAAEASDLKDSYDPFTAAWHFFSAGYATFFPLIQVSPSTATLPLVLSPPHNDSSVSLLPLPSSSCVSHTDRRFYFLSLLRQQIVQQTLLYDHGNQIWTRLKQLHGLVGWCSVPRVELENET